MSALELQKVSRFAGRVFRDPGQRAKYVSKFAELSAANPGITAKEYGADDAAPDGGEVGELIAAILAVMPGISRDLLEGVPVDVLKEIVKNLPASQVDSAVSTFAEKLPAAHRKQFVANVHAVKARRGNATALKLLRL